MLTRRSFIKRLGLGLATAFVAPNVTINELAKADVVPVMQHCEWILNRATGFSMVKYVGTGEPMTLTPVDSGVGEIKYVVSKRAHKYKELKNE